MSSRGRVLLVGGLGGLVIGVISAWLYLQNAQDGGRSDPALPAPADMARLGLSIAAVLRQITALGRSGAR